MYIYVYIYIYIHTYIYVYNNNNVACKQAINTRIWRHNKLFPYLQIHYKQDIAAHGRATIRRLRIYVWLIEYCHAAYWNTWRLNTRVISRIPNDVFRQVIESECRVLESQLLNTRV